MKYKRGHCLFIDSKIHLIFICQNIQVQNRPMFTYRLMFKFDKCLPIVSSINSTNYELKRNLNKKHITALNNHLEYVINSSDATKLGLLFIKALAGINSENH